MVVAPISGVGSTFVMVVRVFHEQCEVIEDKIAILDQLEENGLTPEAMLADTAYGRGRLVG